MARIELATFSLPWKCSATELHRRLGGRGRTCTCEEETSFDLQSNAFAAQPRAQLRILYQKFKYSSTTITAILLSVEVF